MSVCPPIPLKSFFYVVRCYGIAVCFGSIVIATMASFACAQNRLFPQEGSGEGSLIQIPREIERLLSEAKDSVKASAWSEATLAIGILLGLEQLNGESQMRSQDYFTDVGEPKKSGDVPTVRGSMRDEVVSLVNQLPEAGMKVFELRYGVAAKQAVDSAFATGDWLAVERASRDYFCTAAGREAMWLCAEAKISRGLPMDAAVILDRLMIQSRARDRFGVGGYILSAACWKASGQMGEARTRLEEAKKLFPKSSFEWHGKPLAMNADVDLLLESLDLGDFAASKRKEAQPLWVGGSLDRNADTPAGVPLPLVNWKFPMHESEQHEIAAVKTVKLKGAERGISLIPARSPIIVPPWAIMMTYDQRINAIHLKTGKVEWTGSFNRIPYDLSLDRSQGRDGSSMEYPVPEYLARRIWSEAASGQLSSDGRNVYSLSEMPSREASDNLSIGINASVSRPIARRTFNVLQSWSVESQGKLSWEVGGESGISEPALAGVLFLGAPIVHESELLILGEVNTEVFLFVLEPSNGKLIWGQQLVANQASSLADSMLRRSIGCSPSVAAGFAICPTLSGQLLAVDLGSRSLSWAYHFPLDRETVTMQATNIWGSNAAENFHPLKLRSADTSVLITDGCVVHAPIDGQVVYAVSLLDGKKLWEIPKGNTLYVAAGWESSVLLVSDQAVTCLDVHTSKAVWKEPLLLAGMGRVAGRGVRNGQQYFLPMNNQEILEIDIETGKIVDRMRVKEPLGNLVATSDQLISLSPIDLTAYTIRDRLRAEIDIEFAQGKSSAGALQRRGKILLAEGKLAEALDAIEAAYREDREDPEVRVLLGEVAMMALHDDFAKYSPRIADYEELIADGPEKAAYLILLIDGLMREGKHLKATERLLELTAVNSEGRDNLTPALETIDADPTLQVRQEIWSAARLAQLYEAASPSDRKVVEQLVQPQLDSLKSTRRSLDYYRHSDAFRWLTTAGELRLNDAKTVFQEHELLLSEQMLEEAIDVAQRSIFARDGKNEPDASDSEAFNAFQSQADQLRFEIYNKIGRWTTSLAIGKRLGKPLTDVKSQPKAEDILMGNSKRASSKDRPEESDFERYLGGIHSWPKGKPKVELFPIENPLQNLAIGARCVVKQRVGKALENWTASVTHSSIELTGPNGLQRLSNPIDHRLESNAILSAYFVDSIALVETQRELIAMDSLRASEARDIVLDPTLENVLWRESLGRLQSLELQNQNGGFGSTQIARSALLDKPWEDQKTRNRKGFVVGSASRTGVVIAKDSTVFSLDPRTGTRRWTRSGIGASDSLPFLLQDGYQIVVLDRANSLRWILDARDGRLISKETWKDSFDVWCTAGRHVLSAFETKSNNKKISFKLWDAITGETVTEQDYSKDVRAEICDQQRLVTWELNGDLSFWNLQTGKKFDHHVTLPPKTIFKRMMTERFGDAILVMTEGASFRLTGLLASESMDRNHECAGPMIAVDFEDGHPLWENPLMIYDYRFPTTQVRTTPGVTLTRLFKLKVGGRQAEAGSVAILDIRNGQLIYSNDYLDSARGTEFQSCVKSGGAELDIQYRGSELHVIWGDDTATEVEKESQTPIEIGKLDRPQLEAGAPKDWVERLQSRFKEGATAPDGSFNPPFVPK